MSKKKKHRPDFLPTPKPQNQPGVGKVKVPPPRPPAHPVRAPTGNRRGG
jgi:hypothetical protein